MKIRIKGRKHVQSISRPKKRNVVAARRAGITFPTLSKALNIPKSTIATWDKSKKFIDVVPADEILLSHLNINTSLPAKVEKKTSRFVKVVNEGPKYSYAVAIKHIHIEK